MSSNKENSGFSNHPSGNLQFSNADRKVTIQIKEALKLIDVSLLDHLIITEK
ncbi:MAG TPA: JAB domain-containing protein [Puia sp.]